jgi:hypothetical protein
MERTLQVKKKKHVGEMDIQLAALKTIPGNGCELSFAL